MANLNPKLLGVFMTIAITTDSEKLSAAIVQLESEFGQYIEKVQAFIHEQPEIVIEKLKAEFPDPSIQKLFNSPLTPRVIARIQEHLKKKGKEDAD